MSSVWVQDAEARRRLLDWIGDRTLGTGDISRYVGRSVEGTRAILTLLADEGYLVKEVSLGPTAWRKPVPHPLEGWGR